jgi:oxygen-independent coproporphyrinogen-3 oxidase
LNGTRAGLYLHVPFCRRVCPYCDFAVRTGNAERRKRFVDKLLAEIELWRDVPLEFDTIYFGGGTPSQLEPADVARIVEAARGSFRFAEPTTVCLEANPEDVTAEAVDTWRASGVAFVSLGVQSFDPAQLEFLGRMHTPSQAMRAIELALAGGVPTVSVDLIFGLPGQDVTGWRRQLDQATRLGIQHLSCYQLTIHRRTRFGLLESRGRLRQLPDATQADLFELTHRRLADAGYPGYEVSNFAAAAEHRSRHNAKYWTHAPYLGLGPSAHSYRDRERWWNLRRTDPWEGAVAAGRRPIEASERLAPRDLALESLMVGLRTYDGLDLSRLETRWGVPLREANRDLLARFVERGLVRVEGDRVIPTLSGLSVADSLAAEFVL